MSKHTNKEKKYLRHHHNTGFEKRTPHNTPRQAPFAEVYQCSRCGKSIKELSAALSDKTDGNPVHFDCVLQYLQETECLREGEHLSYIGQGRFAVIKYASQVTRKDFSIIRIIEWEDKNIRASWRNNIADIFSRIE